MSLWFSGEQAIGGPEEEADHGSGQQVKEVPPYSSPPWAVKYCLVEREWKADAIAGKRLGTTSGSLHTILADLETFSAIRLDPPSKLKCLRCL